MTREQIINKMRELVPEKYKDYTPNSFKSIPNNKLTDSEIIAKREINRLYYALNVEKIREKQYYKSVKKNKIIVIESNPQ